jgi:hypothetical protein
MNLHTWTQCNVLVQRNYCKHTNKGIHTLFFRNIAARWWSGSSLYQSLSYDERVHLWNNHCLCTKAEPWKNHYLCTQGLLYEQVHVQNTHMNFRWCETQYRFMSIQRNKPFESVLLKRSWQLVNCFKLSCSRGYKRWSRQINIGYGEEELYWKKIRSRIPGEFTCSIGMCAGTCRESRDDITLGYWRSLVYLRERSSYWT